MHPVLPIQLISRILAFLFFVLVGKCRQSACGGNTVMDFAVVFEGVCK
eukprot:Gb_14178 [translate_table: standard]